MVDKIILNAQPRETESQANTLRQQGFLPAVIYGHGEKSQSLTLDYNQFLKVYKTAGSSSLIDLIVDQQPPIKVLIQEVQKDPVSDKLIHIDFHKVKMTEKIHTDITLVYEGEAPAVKELGGTLVKNYDKIEVECLPGDLVPEIKVDISNLKNFHDVIQIKDLVIPNSIVTLVDVEEVIVTVLPTKVEVEAPTVEEVAPVEGAEPTEETTPTEQTEETKGNKG